MLLFRREYEPPRILASGVMAVPLMDSWHRVCRPCPKQPECRKSCRKISRVSARFDRLNELAMERLGNVQAD